jgi:hypothetical protein
LVYGRALGSLTRTVDLCVPGKVDEKATQLHAIASLKVLLDATRPHNGSASAMSNHAMRRPSVEAAVIESGCEAAAPALSRSHQETELAGGTSGQRNGGLGQDDGDPVSMPELS